MIEEIRELRKRLDEAITYADEPMAQKIAQEGLAIAQDKELLGEMMYFKAQREIIGQNLREAVRFLDLAITYNPKDGAAYNDRALCMVDLGMINEAWYYFDKGIEVEPDYATIYHNKGWLLSKVGNYPEALEYYNKALQLEPDRAVTYENIADTLMHLGRSQEALAAYRKTLLLLSPAYRDIQEQIQSRIKTLEEEA